MWTRMARPRGRLVTRGMAAEDLSSSVSTEEAHSLRKDFLVYMMAVQKD
jgi:hypothetical protein